MFLHCLVWHPPFLLRHLVHSPSGRWNNLIQEFSLYNFSDIQGKFGGDTQNWWKHTSLEEREPIPPAFSSNCNGSHCQVHPVFLPVWTTAVDVLNVLPPVTSSLRQPLLTRSPSSLTKAKLSYSLYRCGWIVIWLQEQVHGMDDHQLEHPLGTGWSLEIQYIAIQTCSAL